MIKKYFLFFFMIALLGNKCHSKEIIQDADKYYPIYLMIAEHKTNELIFAIEESKVPLNSIVRKPFSLLTVASHFCNIKFVEYLVDNGVEMNTDNKNGGNPLFASLEVGCTSVFWYLVGKGAQLNFKTENGANLLFAAANGATITEFKFLVEKGLDYRLKTKNSGTVYCALLNNDIDKSVEIKNYLINIFPEGICNVKK